MEVSLSLIYPRTRPSERRFFQHDRATLLSVRVHSVRRSHGSHPSKDLHPNRRVGFYPRWRNARSETVRAEDRAVTESVARSRALHFCPLLHLALAPSPAALSLSLQRDTPAPLSSRRTFSAPLARAYGIRKNAPRSFLLSAISFPCWFNPSRHPSTPSPPPPARSLLLLHYFRVLVLRTYRSFRFIPRNNSVPHLCLRFPPSPRYTHVSTLLLILLSHPFASGARASIQRRVPRLPLLCTCH